MWRAHSQCCHTKHSLQVSLPDIVPREDHWGHKWMDPPSLLPPHSSTSSFAHRRSWPQCPSMCCPQRRRPPRALKLHTWWAWPVPFGPRGKGRGCLRLPCRCTVNYWYWLSQILRFHWFTCLCKRVSAQWITHNIYHTKHRGLDTTLHWAICLK